MDAQALLRRNRGGDRMGKLKDLYLNVDIEEDEDE